MKIALTTAIAMLVTLASCSNQSTEQSNQHLISYQNNNTRFKTELAKELTSNPKSFTYILGNCFTNNGKNYLNVNISRNNFKTSIPVLVNNWQKIEGIEHTNGVGYNGAELKGLKLALNNEATFEYKGLDAVVD